jgi:hypothetical protein
MWTGFTSARGSLWFDEALLDLNVIHRPLRQLLAEPLAYHQGAPPGFLTAQRLMVVLFRRQRPCAPAGALLGGCLALLVFTVGILDLAVVLLLLRRPRPLHSCAFGVAGAVGVICSHPAALVAGGASLVLLSAYLARRDLQAVGGGWRLGARSGLPPSLASSSCCSRARHRRGLARLLAGRVRAATAGARTAPDLAWHGIAARAGQHPGVLASRRRRRGVPGRGARGQPARIVLAALLLAPLPLAAAVARKYPLDGRLTLFLVPVVLLLVAASVDLLAGAPGGRVPVGALAAGVLVAWLPSSRSAGPSGPLRIRSTCPRHAAAGGYPRAVAAR